MKKPKQNFFKDNYLKSWKYLVLSKNFIYLTLLIFTFFFVMGYFIPVPQNIVDLILNFIKELLKQTEGMSQWELTWFIFFNNIKSSFFGMVLGVFLGVVPLITTISNGFLLGFVASKTAQTEGIFILWKLFPHGVFEIPALIISLGLGLKLGTFIFQKKKLDAFKTYFLESLRVFLFVIIPLLIAAAIIEGGLIFLFKG